MEHFFAASYRNMFFWCARYIYEEETLCAVVSTVVVNIYYVVKLCFSLYGSVKEKCVSLAISSAQARKLRCSNTTAASGYPWENNELIHLNSSLHTMLAHLENAEKYDGYAPPPFHTKTAHFLRPDFENGRFWRRNSNHHILETVSGEFSKMMKTNISRRFLNKTHRFLGFRYISLASKSCS